MQKTSFTSRAVQTISAGISILLLLTVILCFAIPYAKAVIPAFGSSHTTGYSAARIISIIWYTFKEAFISTLISVAIGVPAAYFVSQKKFPGREFLLSLGAIPLCIPPLIVALGYIATFGMNGIFNRFLMTTFKLENPPLQFLYSFWGIVITQGFYNFPLVMVTVSDRWETIDKRQSDAAKMLGASNFKIFSTITVHQISGAIISSCIPVFIFCFFSFMIVLLFGSIGGTTLEVAIYHAGRSDLDFHSVAVLSLIESLCALLVMEVYAVFEKKHEKENPISLKKNNTNSDFSPISAVLFLSIILLIALFFLTPIISIFLSSISDKKGSLTLSVWKNVFSMKGFLPSLKNTITTACATASFCSIAGFCYAVFVRLSPLKKNTLIRTIPILPMAVSSVAMGIGMSMTVKQGNQLTLIAAQSALYWPFAYRQLQTHLSAIPQDVINGANLLSPNPLDKIFKIIIPYSWRGIISAFGFTFAMSCGDATLPLVLAIPRFDTLALFTYRLAGSYRFSQASASGFLLGIICAAVFLIANRIKSPHNSKRSPQ
ncbi:MAG: iron ABC transporter permease [Treponema sp.]|nr:iron ABC transporter permease [Treponema sp.]